MTESVLKFVIVGIWVVCVIGAAIFSLMVSYHAFCEFDGVIAKFLVIMTTFVIWCSAINVLKRM